MSHLKAEKRANKHGVVVTKHVRADSGSEDKGKRIPAPAGKVKPPHAVAMTHLDDAMQRDTHGIPGLRKSKIKPALKELSEATVNAFLETFKERPNEGFDEMLLGVLNMGMDDEMSTCLLEIAKLDPSPERFAEYDRGYRFREVSHQVYRGLERYQSIGYYSHPDDMLDSSDPNVLKTRGLARLTLSLFADPGAFGITGTQSYGRTAMILDNPELARLALDRPEDADRIAEIVLERQSTDAELIRSIMDSPTQSLRDGVL